MADAPEKSLTPSPIPPRDKRIVRHIRAMAEAGNDIEKFVKALHAFRDDASLTSAMRDAIFKTMAHDAAQAYYVLVTGEALDPAKLEAMLDEKSA
jgi:hypothetical protein